MVWDFFEKLPIQKDIQRELLKRLDFSSFLDESKEISTNNVHKLHYYISIIDEASLIDPYYWKM